MAAETLGVRPFAEIARGPVAAVFKAYDPGAGTVVLLKALRPGAAADPERRARFAAEARLASEVTHPNVVRVIRVAPDGSALVAEWVEGRDLGALLDARGALPPGLAALVVRGAARGLAAVHAAGIVHRDVKPANVLLGDDGSVRLTDFGLASLAPDADGSEVRGTLATLAPEIVRGAPASPAADVFSLGAVLAHILTGRAPFDAATPSATLDAVLHTDAGAALAADPRVPAPLAALAAAALHHAPEARPTADALADALDALLGTEAGPEAVAAFLAGSGAPPPRLRDDRPPAPRLAARPGPPRRRRRWVPLGLFAAVVATVAALVVLIQPSIAPPPREPAAPGPVALAPASRDTAGTARAEPAGAPVEPGDDAALSPDPGAALPPQATPPPQPVPGGTTDARAQDPDSAPSAEAPAARPPSPPLPAESSSTASRAPGTLVVAAEPWATVRVDGRSLGTTPVRAELAAGTYRLTFENPGFPTHTRTVRIEPGETARAELSLWSLVARVTLDVVPWAEVWVDGTLWDTVPPQTRPLVLAPGAHTLRFEHPTLGRREQTLRVAAGEVRTVRVRMTDP